MNIRIDEGLRAYIDPLTPDEYNALERSLLEEGCRDALILWGDLLVDGHNRYEICRKHNLEFQTRQNPRFKSIEDVHLWMIDNHLGRRSVSDFQRGVLALRKKELLQARSTPPWEADGADDAAPPTAAAAATPVVPAANLTRQALAREARISSNTLGQIEKIRKTAAPELLKAVQDGAVSINAAAAVASLPAPDQQAAVAGGKAQLRAAARQVREAARAALDAASSSDLSAGDTGADAGQETAAESMPQTSPISAADMPGEITRLQTLVARLTQERDQLKKQVMRLTVALAQAREGSDAARAEGPSATA